MKRTFKITALTLGATALTSLAGTVQAAPNDPLLNVLIQKGVLTQQEASDIQASLEKEKPKSLPITLGKTVKGLTLSGDFRGRYEGIYPSAALPIDRHRFRYRLRAGLTYELNDDFEFGVRLASGTAGTDPISTNETLQDNGSKKGITVDLAYGKWTPLKSAEWNGSLTLGKMENPFVFSDMVFDPDYTPEGLAQTVSYNFAPDHTGRLIVGEFVLDELIASSRDPFLLAAQARFDSSWTHDLKSSFGVGVVSINSVDNLTTANVPNVGRGNTRTAGGVLVSHFNPVIVDGSLTYSLKSFPGYKGAFPIKLAADYMNNPATSQNNEAYSFGVTFGKSGKKGLWEFSYRYKELQADAMYEELVDSDFGGVYATAPTGGSAGYQSGTNVRGHIFKAAYTPYDPVTLSLTYFLTELINESPAGSNSKAGRLQADVTLKF